MPSPGLKEETKQKKEKEGKKKKIPLPKFRIVLKENPFYKAPPAQ